MRGDTIKFLDKAAFKTATEMFEKIEEMSSKLFSEDTEDMDAKFNFYTMALEHLVTEFIMRYEHPFAAVDDFFKTLKIRVLDNLKCISNCKCGD